MEWDAATSWQLRGLRGNYGVYVAVTGLRGNYGIYVAVTGSTWRLPEGCHVHPQQPRTSRNRHVVDPVTATSLPISGKTALTWLLR